MCALQDTKAGSLIVLLLLGTSFSCHFLRFNLASFQELAQVYVHSFLLFGLDLYMLGQDM